MITIDISVNGKTVFARSAKNTNVLGQEEGEFEYLTDAGDFVPHNPEDGIVKLAIKIIKTIREV